MATKKRKKMPAAKLQRMRVRKAVKEMSGAFGSHFPEKFKHAKLSRTITLTASGKSDTILLRDRLDSFDAALREAIYSIERKGGKVGSVWIKRVARKKK
jgi:hypothetical protein